MTKCNNCNNYDSGGCNCTKKTYINNNCGCSEPSECACQVYISSDCTNNVKAEFPCLNIETGLPLTQTLEAMDSAICDKIGDIQSNFNLKSVGEGAEIYKGISPIGTKEIKSIKDSDFIKIEEGENDVTPKIDEEVLTNFIEDLLPTVLELESETLLITTNDGKQQIETKEGSNLGDGIEVYKGLSPTTKLQEFYSLKSLSLDITKEVVLSNETGNILIELKVPIDNKTFYVNVNSSSSVENGTISNPYKSFKKAYDVYKGTGTIINPEFNGVGTIELLSNVEIPSSGADSMGYLSINGLKIKGNNFSIVYRGNQEYFFSTEYLVGLDLKTTDGKLDNDIFMSIEDLIIESKTVHGIIYQLNYTSPTFSGTQKVSSLKIENCSIIDSAFESELGSYTDTGIDLFGIRIMAQNSLVTTKYNIVNKDVNWQGESGLNINNTSIIGSSNTIFRNLNTSFSGENIEISFNSFYANYTTLASGVYSPKDSLHFILNENDGLSGKAKNYIRITNFTQKKQQAVSSGSIIGGADSFCKEIGASFIEIKNGSFFSQKVNNLIQITNILANVNLDNFNCNTLVCSDSTYGAFKFIGTTPISRLYFTVNGSTIKDIKSNASFQYIIPTANSAIINDSYFSSLVGYADNSAAISGGLIPNNIYYNTVTNIATRVV